MDFVISALQRTGFDILETKREATIQQYESGSKLLRALNRQGVTAGPAAALAPLSSGELKQVSQLYDRKYKSNQTVRATYDILYLRSRHT